MGLNFQQLIVESCGEIVEKNRKMRVINNSVENSLLKVENLLKVGSSKTDNIFIILLLRETKYI